jgi:hypothetical protein
MRRPGIRDERGDSLIELVVGMTIMVVFLAIFSGAVIMIARTSSHAQAVAHTSADLNSAFLRLDRQVRYAASISKPGTASGSNNWYVEFLSTNTGVSVCTQLRVVPAPTRQLQARTWTVAGTGFSNLSSWTPYANNVTNATVVTPTTDAPIPFALNTSGAVGLERLNVQLVTASGNPAISSHSDVTFTALNSAAAFQAATNSSTYSSSVCNQVARG